MSASLDCLGEGGDRRPPPFDAVVCVGPAHAASAPPAIRALARFAGPRRVFAIAAPRAHAVFAPLRAEGIDVVALDEDAVVPGLTLEALRARLRAMGADPGRAGWYLQQFVKMGAARLEGVEAHYLVWDADTVLLRPTRFLDGNGHALIKPANERHEPYFETLRALLGMERVVDYSFIAESIPVRRDYMQELLAAIEARGDPGRPWPWTVLDFVPTTHLGGSGFSEFETYGNFVTARHPGHFVVRPLPTLRTGARRYGTSPSRADLFRLSLTYAWASFEAWHRGPPRRVAAQKLLSVLVWLALHPRTPWGRAVVRRRLLRPHPPA